MTASSRHTARFTPGPWFQDEQNPFHIVDAQGTLIASTQFNAEQPSASREQIWANTCLVATAPELYEVLTELLKMGESYKTANQFTLLKAHKVLARARGVH
jgi:hypothetical protein